MTAVRSRVDAATTTLEDLDVLEVGSTILWDGRAAEHGVLFSPLRGESVPDIVALVDGEHVDVCCLTGTGRFRLMAVLPTRGVLLSQLLDQVAALTPAGPVLRFASGTELDGRGVREVPAVAVWTGPAVPAWQVPLTGQRPDLRGARVTWQNTLSRRVGGTDPGGAGSRLTATQHPDGGWTLTDAHGTVHGHGDGSGRRTLEQVLTWMTAELHSRLERSPFQAIGARPFAVDDPSGSGPLTVRMW